MSSYKSFQRVVFASVLAAGLFLSGAAAFAGGTDPYGNEDPNKKILKSGLLGAGTGAIASSASGGDAGKGALIGAGTNVVGGALLDMLTTPSQPAQPQYVQQPVYAQQAPVQYAQQPVYDNRQPVYYQQPAYQPVQEDPNKKILKSGLLGAGTGAIAASASGGKAGTGALIGAGTNVIGGALLDTLTTPSQPQYAQQPVYYQQAPPPQYYQQQQGGYQQGYQQQAPRKKIIRKYDSEGNVVSEEEVYE